MEKYMCPMPQNKNSAARPFAVEFRHVTKTFGRIVANHNISFSVPAGTIRALVGENGAGKSTAMKILFGLYKEDSGEILVHGKPQHWRSPKDAILNGIGMVHQHFMLDETSTGLDNIILGSEAYLRKFPFVPTPFNFIDRQTAHKKILAIAQKYGIDVPLNVTVSELPIGMQQKIEILKILYKKPNILILDEPTAVLTPPEVNTLFDNLKKLRDEGKTIIIVTHKLKEILNFTDDITVFSKGHMTGEIKTSSATEEKIAHMMVGKNINLHPVITPAHIDNPKVVLELKNVLNNFHLTLRQGEILGVAGVEGNGQSELVHFACKKNKKTNRAVGFIPEDRHHDGLLLNMSALDNFILGRQWEKMFRFGIFQRRAAIKKLFKGEMKKYDIRPRNRFLNAAQFSGGNQQKIVVAREFGKNPDLIVACNPTRGVDIGAIQFIHEKLIENRDRGAGILLISSELEEITKLSDRILVLYAKKIVGCYNRGEITEHALGLAMCGGAL